MASECWDKVATEFMSILVYQDVARRELIFLLAHSASRWVVLPVAMSLAPGI
jgi:hypothetical protein